MCVFWMNDDEQNVMKIIIDGLFFGFHSNNNGEKNIQIGQFLVDYYDDDEWGNKQTNNHHRYQDGKNSEHLKLQIDGFFCFCFFEKNL